MKYSEAIKPISYLKAHASEVINKIVETRNPVIVTQNGEAKVIVQDLHSYEQMQDTLAMLKILAMGERDIEEGRTLPMDEAFAQVRKKIADKTV